MSALTHAVRFDNRHGLGLVGIVHEPAADRRLDIAVLLLSPGVKNRVAPHRLYNKMASTLVEQGYWVFRFDFSGLGDSEGVINEPYLADFYGTIALGRYVTDALDAMDWLRGQYPVNRFVIGGLCGGAITGVLTAPQRSDVAGLLGLGLPLMVEGRHIDRHRNVTAGQLNSLRGQYVKKLASPRAWVRLLSLRSDWRMAVKSIVDRYRRPRAAAGAVPQAPIPGDNANVLFAPAFLQTLERGCPALLLFSEMDRLWWEFDEKFLVSHRAALTKYGTLVEIGIVPGANHTFTLEEWQADMMSRVGAWLDRHIRPQANRVTSDRLMSLVGPSGPA